mmetsp:Transcript_30718/g.34275  ORF Transcript_30718/g.34275 Transcript_30718/m.34275 type:complete len:149 (-) Transcript_30718:165-611(-)
MATYQLWRYARVKSGKQRQFAKFEGVPKPKTEEGWKNVWKAHKIEIPAVSKLTLQWSRKGKGNTGARYFKYYSVPPIKHWNPNITVEYSKEIENAITPTLTIETFSGATHKVDIEGMHVDKIVKRVQQLNDAEKPPSQSESAKQAKKE